ncbi:3-phenylpropionate MFS transporter [Mergibacter septicus]|uniref:3-phenylpropionate MFS transporter n=1 Tax=Mergibacter septicus TaxID=221402 RepID=UPI0011791CE6|nr:3-phenylpropionate MFS transporter [Mergibacter septicus]AWX14138.1 3-phenylpropionate MFS transporter [Mergibacter septicus]
MKIRAVWWIILCFFGYYCVYGIFMPLFPVWLKSQQYSTETIALIIAGAYVFRFIGGIYFSSLITKVSQIPKTLIYLAGASVLTTLLIAVMAQYFWVLLLGIALFSMFNAAGIPLLDTLASAWQHQIRLDYGKIRLIGSGAFVVGVIVFGGLISHLGDNSIIWVIFSLLLGYTLLQLLPLKKMPRDKKLNRQHNNTSYLALLRNPTTTRLLLAVALIQGSHSAFYTYSTIFWAEKGFSLQTTSILWGVGVIAEIILFFFASRLFKNWSENHLFYLSGIAACFRWSLFYFADNLALIFLLQCSHCLTYATSHYATVKYIATQSEEKVTKLQALYSTTSGCAAIALLTALSGIIYPHSPLFTFLTMAFLALVALFIIPYHQQTQINNSNLKKLPTA